MTRRLVFSLALFALVTLCAHSVPAQILAPTPPMGWNSWDSYGLTINEQDYRANTTVLAELKQFGWQYAVIDEGWYAQQPSAEKVLARKYVWDNNGILIPALNRFPSAAGGVASSRWLTGFTHKGSSSASTSCVAFRAR
jgi:hypothetical protein